MCLLCVFPTHPSLVQTGLHKHLGTIANVNSPNAKLQPHRQTLGKALCSSVGGISLLQGPASNCNSCCYTLQLFLDISINRWKGRQVQCNCWADRHTPCYQNQILPPLVYCELAQAEESLLLDHSVVLFIFRMLGIPV